MTDGIKRRNVIREMQKRTIGEALYSKKIGRKPNASAKKIGVLPARQGQSRAWLGCAEAKRCKARAQRCKAMQGIDTQRQSKTVNSRAMA